MPQPGPDRLRQMAVRKRTSSTHASSQRERILAVTAAALDNDRPPVQCHQSPNVQLTDGVLNVDLVRVNGDPHLMGMAIFN